MIFRFNVDKYFIYSQEEKERYVAEIAKYYYEKYVSTENRELCLTSINELILFFELKIKVCETNEEYE